MLGTILLDEDLIILGLNVVTDLGSLEGSFDGAYDVNLDKVLFEGLLGYTSGKLLGSDEGIKLVASGGEVVGTLMEDVYVTLLVLDVSSQLDYLDGYYVGSNYGNF